MKDDDNKPDMKTWIDPELEARVVAWVAGEASPFEIAELERIVAAQPELAVFKRRIEAVHGLVREVARPDATPLLLAPERRAKLLAVLEGTEKKESAPAAPASEKPKVVPFYAGWQRVVGRYAWVGGVAAMAVFGVFVATRKVRMMRTYAPPPAMAQEMKIRANDERSDLSVADQEKMKERVDAALRVPAARRQTTDNVQGVMQGGGQMADYNISLQRGGAGGGGGLNLPASAPANAKAMEINQARTFNSVTFGQGDAYAGQTAVRPNAYYFAGTEGKNENRLAGSNLSVSGSGNRQIHGIGGALAAGPSGGTLTLGANQTTTGTLTLNERGAVIGGMAGSVSDARTRGLDDAGSPPVKMDAFVVSEGREGYAAAMSTMSGSRFAAPVISLPTLPAPAPVELSAFSVTSANSTPAAKAGRGGFSGSFGSGAKKDVVLSSGASFGYTSLGDSKPEIIAPTDIATVQAPPPSLAKTNTAPARTESHAFITVEGLKAKETDDEKRPAPLAPAEPPSTEETSTAKEPVSTFSLHVSDVSFRLAQSALARGQLPDAALIRPEEIYNAFDYGDPATPTAEKVGIRIEQSAHPFLQQRNLVRIAVKVPATGRNATQPLKLTVLLDTSGSMEREDRVTTVRRAMEVLCSLLGPQDRVTLIGFARQPRLLAEDVAGDRAKGLLDLIARTPAEGGTNLEAALKLGGELARRHRQLSAQNRIVVLTDGAANLGDADPVRLAAMVEELRNQGIAFDACGVGLNGLDDAMLEPLTRKGDGRYYVLDSADSADAGFARQLAGAFRPAAENVKLQVRFNPARVANYRLIGFEKHRLKTEDFRNDRVDAAELAAEEAAVAVYQVEALPSGEGELGEVSVRFRDAADGAMVERTWTMIYDAQAPAFDRAAPSLRLAGVAALVAEKLRGSPQADQFKLGDFAGVVNGLRSHYASQVRVQEFAMMFTSLRRIRGE